MRIIGSDTRVLCQETVEVIGEVLAIPLAHRRWPAGIHPTGPHRVQEVTHVEAGSNILRGVQFASRTQCVTALIDDLGGKRNIARDHEIART